MKKALYRVVMVGFGALLITGMVLAAGANTANAAKTIKLTFGGLYPPTHPISVADQAWVDRIEKASNGRVKIKIFWAGALYKPRESVLELAKGVADLGDMSGAYSPRGFDFEKSGRMVFWGADDPKMILKIQRELVAKYPQLSKEFTDAGVKLISYSNIPPYNLLLAKKKIEKAEDFKGLSLKGSGDLSKLAGALGGNGIILPMSETYTALQKSTIDGAFTPYETMRSFRFAEVVKYALELKLQSAPGGRWGFCMHTWKKLPKDIQQIFLDNGEWLGLKCMELMAKSNADAVEIGKENNVEFYQLPKPELDKVYAAVDATIRDQMKDLDAKGLPGTEVYEELRRLIDEYSK